MRWELRTRRGETAPNAGTDNTTAARIRSDWDEGHGGYTQRELARKYAVSLSVVKRITAGYTYTP